MIYCKKCGKELKEGIDLIRTIITYSPEGKKEEHYCIYCNAVEDQLEEVDCTFSSEMVLMDRYQVAKDVLDEFYKVNRPTDQSLFRPIVEFKVWIDEQLRLDGEL